MVDSREVLVAPQKNRPPGEAKTTLCEFLPSAIPRTEAQGVRHQGQRSCIRKNTRMKPRRSRRPATNRPRALLPRSCATEGSPRTPGTFLPRPRRATLTHFADGEGAGVAGVDLGRPAPGEVEQLHQAGHHLVLLLRVAQPAVAAEAPGEDALLGVKDQLWRESTGWGQACRRGNCNG